MPPSMKSNVDIGGEAQQNVYVLVSMICHHCVRTYMCGFSFLTTVPQATMSKSSPYRTQCWKPETKKPPSGGNIHVHVHFVLRLLRGVPDHQKTCVWRSNTGCFINHQSQTDHSLESRWTWSIHSRRNTRGCCGPLWKIDPVLLSDTTCSSSIH